MSGDKIGLIFSHLHVRETEEYKFDILSYAIDHFKQIKNDIFIVVSGHGIAIPEFILDKIQSVYWEDKIDNNEIGRGHPRFCIKGYDILKENNIQNSIKLRGSDIIKNTDFLYSFFDSEAKIALTEQTCLEKGMIGDLLMVGKTDFMLEFWSVLPWDYSKSGLYNLYDNVIFLASRTNISVKEFLTEHACFVGPEEIGWYTFENNWNTNSKSPKEALTVEHLWGKIPGYSYHGGFDGINIA